MRLVCNYLTELVSLINENKVELDYVKYPSISYSNIEELENLSNKVKNKIIFHNTFSKNGKILTLSDEDFIKQVDLEKMKEALKLSRINGISVHIADKTSETKNSSKTEDEIIKIIVDNTQYLYDNIKDLEFFTIENREYGTMFEKPEFLNKVFNKVKCKFLIDISHCKGAADKLRIWLN